MTVCFPQVVNTPGGGLGSSFAGYVLLASQNLYPIIVYFVASYRPYLIHFRANVNVISRTEFNASRLLNIKATSQQQEPFFNRKSSSFLEIPAYQNFLIPKIPKICDPILVTLLNTQPHYSQSSCENATSSSGTSPVVFY